MNPVKYIEYLRTNMKTLKKVLIAYLAAVVLFDVILPRDAHAHYFVDKIWGFWTLFGVVGCFLLIKVGKGIAHMFLSKNEDFYG
jgi:hypothetical protein